MLDLLDRQTHAAVLTAAALVLSGTAPCGIVADLTPGTANDNNIAGLACAFGEELYFSNVSATLGGSKLWKWTELGGAVLVAPGSSHHDPHYITPCVTALGPRVFYSAFAIGQGYELHASDGAGAVLAPSFSVPVPVPNSVALEGQVFNFQTVWVHATASPTLQASNAVQLALGAAAPHSSR